MPFYDFRCSACNRLFERNVTMKQVATASPECPHCKSRNTKRAWTHAPRPIIRPSGYNLHPEDPGYSHFNRDDLDRRVTR